MVSLHRYEVYSLMTSVRVRFSPGFLPGAGFPGEHVFRGFSGAPALIIEV
jgi:hypothetical protein